MMAKELAEEITRQVRAKDIVAICDPKDNTVIVWDARMLLFLKCRNSGRLTKAQHDELGCWLARMNAVNVEAMVVGQRDWPRVKKMIAAREER